MPITHRLTNALEDGHDFFQRNDTIPELFYLTGIRLHCFSSQAPFADTFHQVEQIELFFGGETRRSDFLPPPFRLVLANKGVKRAFHIPISQLRDFPINSNDGGFDILEDIQIFLFEEPIYLISSLSDAELACKYYKKRYRLETLFSDQKSRGFHIHKSHISDPQRLNRLLLASCLTFIWTIYLGLDVIARGQRGLIDRTHRRDKSLFRLGLDWFKYRLKYGYPIPVFFDIPPEFSLRESVR